MMLLFCPMASRLFSTVETTASAISRFRRRAMLRSSLFWVVTHRRLVGNGRFGTAYRFHILGSRSLQHLHP